MRNRPSVYDLWSQKGKKKWAQTHIDTDKEAEAAYKSGADSLPAFSDVLIAYLKSSYGIDL